jgi:hypothetical protein
MAEGDDKQAIIFTPNVFENIHISFQRKRG